MRSTLAAHCRQLLSPMALAAYLAWLAVWLSTEAQLQRMPELAWPMRLALVGFLAGFTFEHLVSERFGLGSFIALATVLGGIALWVIAYTPYGASPILLVLLTGMLASRLQGRWLLLSLLIPGIGMAAIVLTLWPGKVGNLAVTVIAYVSFQAFAVVVIRYARRAEQMSEALRAANAELIATRSLLAESARDSERLRLSRELHDVAGHGLTALKLNLGALARDSRQPDPERVALCAGLADELLQNLRSVVRQMRAHEGIDLSAAIERLAAPFPRPRVQLDIDTDARMPDLERAEALLRTVQEGLTNAARHAAAERVWLSLKREGDRVRLELHDDGRGALPLTLGNGLRGMQERLTELGGELRIDRGPQGGLRLSAMLPVAAA